MCIQATCSTDGQLRIYEAPDVMNLSQWSLLVSLMDELMIIFTVYFCSMY